MSWFLLVILFCCMMLIVYMYREAHRNTIRYEQLKFDSFPESFGELKVFFISDIHRRIVSEEIIASLTGRADLVIIGGDITEKGVPFSRVLENINRLKKIGPLYFVWGNNDYEVDYHELDALLINHGVKILDNTALSFESTTGEKLALIGVDDMNRKRDRLDLALSDCDKVGFRMLVSHDPRIMRKINNDDHIHFVMSGHTHGGQIRLGRLGFYHKGGISHHDKTVLLISNGYGTTSVPLRFGAPAETHFITISKK
ncbi:metallophosphoesterase [Bacillus salitolerans]|uniref:Metallophosphoesterase n=1 Tax=Bacillus salitolerans TaxID=1437434 RepID=A0ABW4LTT4_9BACI